MLGQHLVLHELDDPLARIAVERRRGFVEDHEVGTARERARDRDALLLAAAQARRIELRPCREADDVEVLRRLLDRRRPSRAA